MRTLASLALSLFAFAAGARGQERVVIQDGGCNGCRIRLVRVAVIAGADPYTLDWWARVTKTRDGYAAAPLHVPGTIGVFDERGRLLRTVGSEGRGPGEFLSIWGLATVQGDTVLVVENSRLTVLDPDLRYVRTLGHTGRVQDVVQLADGRYVLRVEGLPSPHPLHVMDASGRLVHSFGPSSARASTPNEGRELVVGRNGRLYAARKQTYEIEEYDAAGRLLRVLERRADWFAARDPERPGRPFATINDLGIDEEGRLVVLSGVLVPEYVENLRKQARRGAAEPQDHASARLTEAQALAQTRRILEVIDPETGTVIAQGQAPTLWLTRFVGPGLVASKHDEADGFTSYTVWRIVVDQPSDMRGR